MKNVATHAENAAYSCMSEEHRNSNNRQKSVDRASCEARAIRPKMMCDSPHGSLTNLFLRLNSKRSRGRYCNHSSLELSPGIKFVQLVEKLLVLFVAFCALALQKERTIEVTQRKKPSVNAELEENISRLPQLGFELLGYLFQGLE